MVTVQSVWLRSMLALLPDLVVVGLPSTHRSPYFFRPLIVTTLGPGRATFHALPQCPLSNVYLKLQSPSPLAHAQTRYTPAISLQVCPHTRVTFLGRNAQGHHGQVKIAASKTWRPEWAFTYSWEKGKKENHSLNHFLPILSESREQPAAVGVQDWQPWRLSGKLLLSSA